MLTLLDSALRQFATKCPLRVNGRRLGDSASTVATASYGPGQQEKTRLTCPSCRQPPPASAQEVRGPRSADDVAIGLALTTMWVLATGRRLRCDVPLFHDLPEGDLIDFWADDHINHGAKIP